MSTSAKNPWHVCHISGGVSSWGMTKLIARYHGTERLVCVFAETYFEDSDLYRFLVESTANIMGVPVSGELREMSRSVGEVEDRQPDLRRQQLDRLRARAMQEIPGLAWIAEGRTPFEVFKDVRFLGNSRIDPCSRVLKREFIDAWAREHCPPDAIHCIGFDIEEGHRAKPLRKIFEGRGQRVAFPLLDNHISSFVSCRAWLQQDGIALPRAYDMGFTHNNCGGCCVKAGQRNMKNLLTHLPRRFDWLVGEEDAMRAQLGNVSILRDRTGGVSKPLPLRVFRDRLRMGMGCDELDQGACSCMAVDTSPEEPAL